MENQEEKPLLIFGIENPLIDISLVVHSEDLFERYKIVKGTACLASAEQLPLYTEIWNSPGMETMPGGSTLNTIRAANWFLKDVHPNRCGYFGCIGKDE